MLDSLTELILDVKVCVPDALSEIKRRHSVQLVRDWAAYEKHHPEECAEIRRELRDALAAFDPGPWLPRPAYGEGAMSKNSPSGY